MKKILKKEPYVAFAEFNDNFIIIPLKEDRGRVENSIYILEGMLARIWELLDGERTLYEIKRIILEEYKHEEEVEKKISKAIEELKKIKAICEAK